MSDQNTTYTMHWELASIRKNLDPEGRVRYVDDTLRHLRRRLLAELGVSDLRAAGVTVPSLTPTALPDTPPPRRK